MNNVGRLPLVFMGGGNILPLKNGEGKLTTLRYTRLCLSAYCTHGRQTPVRNETAAVMLSDAAGLWLNSLVFLIPFFLQICI